MHLYHIHLNIENKYLTANEEASEVFYHNNILYSRELMSEKKNIKYYAEGNNNKLGNTNDDIKNIQNNADLIDKYQWYLKIAFNEKGELTYASFLPTLSS